MKNKYLTLVEQSQLRHDIKQFSPGDSVIVSLYVKDGNKARIQTLKGFILGIKNRGINSSFTIRRMSYGEGMEKIIQTHNPLIKNIIIEKRAKVRRAKLYYMRNLFGKSARIKEKV